jgi:hypothetical protein
VILQLQSIVVRVAKYGFVNLCLIHALSIGTAWAAIASRPNIAQAGPVVQRSALPTQPTGPKGEVGGVNTSAQKSTASIGGPSVSAAKGQNSTNPGIVKPNGNNNLGKSTSTPK